MIMALPETDVLDEAMPLDSDIGRPLIPTISDRVAIRFPFVHIRRP